MSAEANEALAHRFHMDIFQQGNLAVADEIVTPDFVIHSPGLPPQMQRGAEGVKQFAAAIRNAFPNDLRITHDDTISAGDKVVIRWSSTGTHNGVFMGIPPTGKPTTVTGIDIFRIAGGKLGELWQNWDQLGLLQQIGAIPAPGQAGT
jgi:steroid delta-isomerase-like uncharacterized protein